MIATDSPRKELLAGYAASFGAAASYGTVALLGRMVLRDLAPPLVVTAFSMVFGTLVLAIIFHRQALQDLRMPRPRRAWIFVALAGVSSAWGVTFFFFALNEAPVVLVAPLAGISPLVSLVLMWVFLRRMERITWQTVVGALLVVTGVVVIASNG